MPLFQEQLLRMAMVAAGFTGGQAEELRRAMGFKRSEKRMKQIEVQLREGMARKGITGDAAEQIITSIASFALYGFPESHAASFALLAYASAYLKVHYPAAFYTALLNNQPMGFYHPSTLVKDAQRRGVRFHPIDVQISDWDCTVEARRRDPPRPALRERPARAGRPSDRAAAVAVRNPPSAQSAIRHPRSARVCPKCGCDDRVDARAGGRVDVVLQQLLARLDPAPPRAAVPLARRSRRPRRPAPRRARDARRHRRAQRVRLRPPLRAVAGRARRPAQRRAVHEEEGTAEHAETAEIFFENEISASSAVSAVSSDR